MWVSIESSHSLSRGLIERVIILVLLVISYRDHNRFATFGELLDRVMANRVACIAVTILSTKPVLRAYPGWAEVSVFFRYRHLYVDRG